jgi:hypothetical protein
LPWGCAAHTALYLVTARKGCISNFAKKVLYLAQMGYTPSVAWFMMLSSRNGAGG